MNRPDPAKLTTSQPSTVHTHVYSEFSVGYPKIGCTADINNLAAYLTSQSRGLGLIICSTA